MKPAAFEYERAATVENALQALAAYGERAKVLAGGQSLIPMHLVNATLVARSANGEREIAAGKFFNGSFSTVLGADELLVEIRIPVMSAQCGWSFQEFSQRKGDFALVAAGALLTVQGGR